jgi:hypothetical protein
MKDKVVFFKQQRRQPVVGSSPSVHNHICKGDAVMSYLPSTKVCSKCKKEKPVSEFHKDKHAKDGKCYSCKVCTKNHRELNKEVILKREAVLREKNRERIRATHKEWRTNNKEKVSEYGKTYCAANKEKVRKSKKKYREANKEKITKKNLEWYNSHKDDPEFITKRNERALAAYNANKDNDEYKNKRRLRDNKRYAIKKHDKCFLEKQYAYKRKSYLSRKDDDDFKESLAKRKQKYLQTENGKEHSRKYTQKRRALKLKVTVEDFSHKDVFLRDGYICQCCKTKTRPDYKHTHPLYPHLDHIQPLSLGGDHSKVNTQCLCANCNLTKHNTGTGDQLRIF